MMKREEARMHWPTGTRTALHGSLVLAVSAVVVALAVSALALAGLPQAADGDVRAVQFLLRAQIPLHPYPRALAGGDFDRDGHLDLAVVNGSRDTVSILFGTGRGSFVSPHAVRFPAGADAIAVADMDRDGKLDLVVGVSARRGSVSIRCGRGDGTFASIRSYALGSTAGIRNPGTLSVADVNGDRKRDVAAARGSRVFVLLGRGDGTCRSAVSYVADARGSIASFAFGRLDGDRLPDVVAGSQEGVNTPVGALSTMIGSSAGIGRARTTRTGMLIPDRLALGDVNRDGDLDLLVGNTADVEDYGSGGQNHVAVVVSLGRGDGSFSRLAEYGFGTLGLSALEVTDFNGDGNADLLAASAEGLDVLMGNGDGSFLAADRVDATRRVGGALTAVGDLDGDGRPDVAVAAASGRQLSILLTRTVTAEGRRP
jgi:hypothetical protein